MDDFAGLTYKNDQKAKIRQIHQDIKKRMDTVVKDNKLSPEQRGAILQGYQHMERGEVYRVLTADQQKEVRKKALALLARTVGRPHRFHPRPIDVILTVLALMQLQKYPGRGSSAVHRFFWAP